MVSKLPSMVVSAVTTFDGKALSKGQKQIGGFEKSLKSVGKSLGVAFSATAVIAFGKAAASAFIKDEKAAAQLAQSVKNLGLAFETPAIEKFISELSAASGVTDDVLRPSMQKLLQTTNSVKKSTELLTQALDISRGSGVDYETVISDLSAAYLGQTRGLSKYSLGLTKAELKSMSFAEILEKLTDQFSGANSAYLATYAGKLELITTAAGEAQETIGKGLIDAFSILATESGSVTELTDAMNNFADGTATAFRNVAVLVSNLDKAMQAGFGLIGVLDQLSGSNLVKIFGGVAGLLGTQGAGSFGSDNKAGMGRQSEHTGRLGYVDPDKAKRDKIEKDRLKLEKERIALANKGAKAEKQKVSLSKAAAVFDSTRISLTAALSATYDKETKLRLEALMLIEQDKGDEALKKIGELAAFQKNADLQRLAGVTEISNATLGSLNTQLLTELKVINTSRMAEGDKELAREEAFKKYNAAITAAGTLASKESYNERVQIQLTEIARLAAISKTYSAAATANLLLESAELSMIDRVAIAQKAADDQRLAALKDYQNALNGIGGGGGGTNRPMSFVENGPLGGLAAGVIAGVIPTLSQMPTLTDTAPTYGYNPTQGFPGQSVEVTINAGIGDPEAIARAVEDLLNQSTYRGTSVNRGAGNYVL